jgi:hypothetical protein
MNKPANDAGSAEAGAALLLFFLSALVMSAALGVSVVLSYVQRNSREQAERLQADTILAGMVQELQELTLYPYDDRNNGVLRGLAARYARYNITIEDVSSGYHLDFLSDRDLEDPLLRGYLFVNGAAGFIARRDAQGLAPEKDRWRPFIRDDAWDACVSYGWINPAAGDSFALRGASASFNARPEDLFPLVNELPLINVNMIQADILKPLILRPAFNIENPEEKMELLKNRLARSPVLAADIGSLLRIPGTHALFAYLGVKTAFWKLSFTLEKMTVEALIGAIPDRNSGNIREYRLIDRRIEQGAVGQNTGDTGYEN